MGESNAEQRHAWEQGVGAKWVARSDDMDRRLAPVSAVLLARAAPALGECVLDVGCGTGALLGRLAESVGERGRVVGVDLSDTMLGIARRTAPDGVELLRADAQDFAFPPEAFDLVVSRFGVMFFAEPVRAFRNLRRAMRRGGRLCFAAWAPLGENLHWQIPLAAAVHRLGRPEATDPRAPGPFAFSDEGYVRGILGGAGFGDVRVEREQIELPGGSPREEAEQGLAMGPAARLLEDRPPVPQTRAAILHEIETVFSRYERDGRCALPATVLVVTAGA